jgi:hypothetical protein
MKPFLTSGILEKKARRLQWRKKKKPKKWCETTNRGRKKENKKPKKMEVVPKLPS